MSARVRVGYKQTEVGEIPQDWDVQTFAELFSFRNGVNADKACYGQGTPFINVLEPITYSHLYGHEITGQVTLPEPVTASYAVRHGDVLFNRTSETQDEIGLAAAYLGSDRVVFGGFVIRGRPTNANLDPRFCGYSLRAPAIRSQLIPMGQGAIRANIGQQNLGRVVTAVPPLPEQRAIATALSDVDALLAKLDALVTKKRDIKTATMQQLLTGKTRLPGFAGEWVVKRLGDVVGIRKGQLITEKDAIFGDIPVIAGGKKPSYFHNQPNRVGKTITVSASGASAGYVAFFETPIFASDCSTIGDGKAYSIEFVYFQLLLKQDVIYRAQTGGAQPHIHAVDLMPLEIGACPLAEQTAIATVLTDMDAELAALEARCDKTRALKQGMMQALLTGRIRLV